MPKQRIDVREPTGLAAEDKCASLQSELNASDKKRLQPIYDQAEAVGLISANQLLKSLREEGQNSPAFVSILCFLNEVEGACRVTYGDGVGCGGSDSNGPYLITLEKCPSLDMATAEKQHVMKMNAVSTDTGIMTLGVGLNVANSDAAAVVYAVDPSLNFKTLQSSTGQPQPPLTDKEITDMLYYTLVGVTNSAGTFGGELPALIAKLEKAGLADKPYPLTQLITLLSLAFNNPSLIGDGLISALQANDDLSVLMEITEYSNKDLSVGISIRRLKEGGFFHNLDDIFLTWREYWKLCLSAEQYHYPPHYFSTHALPKGNDQSVFLGGSTITTIAGRDEKKLDTLTYGTTSDEVLVVENVGATSSNPGHKVIFGGDGNDLMQVTPTDSYKHYHFMAGGNGYDRYDISSKGYFFIEDADNVGEIFDNDYSVQGIFNIQTDGSYYLSGSGGDYHLYKGTDDIIQVRSTSLSFMIKNSGQGEMGIITAEKPTLIAQLDKTSPYSQLGTAVILQNKNIIAVRYSEDSKNSFILFDIYTLSGKKLFSYPMTFDFDCTRITYADFIQTLFPAEDPPFIIFNVQNYAESMGVGQKFLASYYSQEGVFLNSVQIFPPILVLPCFDSLNQPNCFFKKIKATTLKNGQIAVAFEANSYESHAYPNTGNSDYFVFIQVLNNDWSIATPPFLVDVWKKSYEVQSILLTSYGIDEIAVAISYQTETASGTDTEIKVYMYSTTGVLIDSLMACDKSCNLLELSSFNQEKAFLVSYNGDSNDGQHSRVIHSSMAMTPVNTFTYGLQENGISITLKNDNFFIVNNKRGVLLDSNNQIFGSDFSMLTTINYDECTTSNIVSSEQLENGDIRLIAFDDYHDRLCYTYVNIGKLPPAKPQNLPWESSRTDTLLTAHEMPSQQNLRGNANARHASLPNVSFDSQLALASIAFHYLSKWFSSTASDEKMHELSNEEETLLKKLSQTVIQLERKLLQRAQNKDFLNQTQRDCIDDAEYLLSKTKTLLTKISLSHQVSEKMLQTLNNDMERIHGWIEKLPHYPVFPKAVSTQSNHWTGLSLWSNNRNYLRTSDKPLSLPRTEISALENQSRSLVN